MTNLIERENNQQVSVSAVNQPMRLLELAVSNNADVDKLEKLMALQERWDAEQARKAYFTALADLQSELPVIRKLKTASFPTKNGHMSYNFASLDDISEQIKPFLQKHGFSYRFEQDFASNAILITCIITHKSGHSEKCSMPGGADTSGNKNALQQAASTVTYLRRYTLTGALGIATADQDIDGRIAFNEGANSLAQEQSKQNELPPMSSEKWNELYPQYQALVESGKKTASDIIKAASSKYLLTEDQKEALRQLGE